jgi:predicted NAD/FAD-binding protein
MVSRANHWRKPPHLLQALLAKHPDQAVKLVPERSNHVALRLLPFTAKETSEVRCDEQALLAIHPEQAAKLVPERSNPVALSILR